MSRVPKGGRRRLDASTLPEYDVPTRKPRINSPRTAQLIMAGVFVAWAVGTLGSATSLIEVSVPSWVERPSGALLMIVFAIGLIQRGGGHLRIWLPMTAVLGILAATLQTNLLLAAAAAVTAVLASVWAVLVTRPASSIVGSIREYVLALVVALSGTLGVAAWNAPVNYQRFNLIVVTVALSLAITLVWNLGAGLHGLGRQSLAILLGVAALLMLVLVYSSFVRTHGSQSLVQFFSDLVMWTRRTFHGVPRPVEVFIGFPALIVGVSLRSKRREGWWVQVFAVIGTAVLATSLVTPGAFPTYIGLSTLYSAILGLLVGLVVRSRVMKERSSRAARTIEEVARVEPRRFSALK
ncbi:hypothetical protein [Aeromicrobium sp.]|uniref:hypothetical protein n=1 Tax=Aeromicrobium sp. TaxID=1871063 RepID=UPI0019A47CEB|nr:hypothetical protein [Aeromicrobium sp.]MBC7632197.1 hypothetical protein [Aeromicrobium sp.]